MVGGAFENMKICKYTFLGAVILVLSFSTGTTFAAEAPETDDSVVLSNLDEPEANGDIAKNPGASPGTSARAPASNTAAGGTAGVTSDGKAPTANEPDAVTPMEKYKDLRVQQAATQNGVNPATARRYLRVDKSTMMQESGQQ